MGKNTRNTITFSTYNSLGLSEGWHKIYSSFLYKLYWLICTFASAIQHTNLNTQVSSHYLLHWEFSQENRTKHCLNDSGNLQHSYIYFDIHEEFITWIIQLIHHCILIFPVKSIVHEALNSWKNPEKHNKKTKDFENADTLQPGSVMPAGEVLWYSLFAFMSEKYSYFHDIMNSTIPGPDFFSFKSIKKLISKNLTRYFDGSLVSLLRIKLLNYFVPYFPEN